MNVTKTAMATVLLLLLCSFSLFAQGTQSQSSQQEEIILTTYYPVPYGDYDKFLVNRMAVGDVNGDGQQSVADLPPQDGQLSVARSVIYTPQQNAPKSWSAGSAGELAFSKDEGAFYYYNGSKWVAQGGEGGTMYTLYGTQSCPTDIGWQVVYTGYAMTNATTYGIANVWVVGGGGIVCKAGPEFSGNGSGLTGYVAWITSMKNDSAGPIPCVVCAK